MSYTLHLKSLLLRLQRGPSALYSMFAESRICVMKMKLRMVTTQFWQLRGISGLSFFIFLYNISFLSTLIIFFSYCRSAGDFSSAKP
jgi:hypothetical protein